MENSINERIKILRKVLELSQTEFAKAINISQTSLSSIEKGKHEPKYNIVEAIVNTFNVNPRYLLLIDEPEMFLNPKNIDLIKENLEEEDNITIKIPPKQLDRIIELFDQFTQELKNIRDNNK